MRHLPPRQGTGGGSGMSPRLLTCVCACACRYGSALGGSAAAARRRGLWAGCGLGLGWLLTYSLNAVVFAYGAQLVVRDRELPPEQQDYHPGVMVTVSSNLLLLNYP